MVFSLIISSLKTCKNSYNFKLNSIKTAIKLQLIVKNLVKHIIDNVNKQDKIEKILEKAGFSNELAFLFLIWYLYRLELKKFCISMY